jgi:DNA-binding transcriptional ArsR family regulator
MFESSAPQTQNRWDLYRILSEPVRLQLLALSAEEELAIGELAELLGESQPNVSRHVAPLKQAGLVVVRKQGTRALVGLRDGIAEDPVIADALASGRALSEADGSLARIDDVLRARDAVAREYFAEARRSSNDDMASRAPAELGAYLAALSLLLPERALAVDAGTGDGGLLEVLAPAFEKVVAVDRSGAQLAQARARVAARRFQNVTLIEGELDSAELKSAVGRGADVVFAVRLLHHASKPAKVVAALSRLLAPGGALIILDYARHEDESMRDAADLWLGFEPDELKKFAREASLEKLHVSPIGSSLVSAGPDRHLPWQVLVGRKSAK